MVPAAKHLKNVTTKDITEEQGTYEPLDQLAKNEDGRYRNDSRIWISKEAVNLKLRITVEAHCGECGHRAYDATLEIINATYR